MTNWFALMEQMVDVIGDDNPTLLGCTKCPFRHLAVPETVCFDGPTQAVISSINDNESGCPEGFDLETWFKQLDDPDQE